MQQLKIKYFAIGNADCTKDKEVRDRAVAYTVRNLMLA
jgi:hypothetical protein